MTAALAQGRGAVLAPIVRAPRLSDRVADQMLAAILERKLPPGSRLPSERELCDQFGVSRTVVREATRSLFAKGLLEARPGTGLVVAAVDASAVAESMNLFLRGGGIPYDQIHEVRTMIEIQVAGLAAERGTPPQIEHLGRLHEHLTVLTDGTDFEALALADVEFHRQLARMTGNALHLLMLDAIGDVLVEVRRETVANREGAAAAVRAHAGVLDCVAAHDAAGARDAMGRHLEQAFQEWKRLDRPVGAPAAGTPAG